ncbi:MAG: TM2 domain-containing protein [Pseudomonadota bacterium]
MAVASGSTGAGKSLGLAYVTWFLLGPIGGHRFYLDRPLSALAMCVLFLAPIATVYLMYENTGAIDPNLERLSVFVAIGSLTVLVLWLLVDATQIPTLLGKVNGRVFREATDLREGEKSLGRAYVLWLFLGFFSAHRFYLGRGMPALMFLMAFVIGLVLMAVSQLQWGNTFYVGLALLTVAAAGWLVDMVMLPGQVETHNDRLFGEDRQFAAKHGSLEPGFQATARAVGLDTNEGPKKKAIPEDYVMPWRDPAQNTPAARYDPTQD